MLLFGVFITLTYSMLIQEQHLTILIIHWLVLVEDQVLVEASLWIFIQFESLHARELWLQVTSKTFSFSHWHVKVLLIRWECCLVVPMLDTPRLINVLQFFENHCVLRATGHRILMTADVFIWSVTFLWWLLNNSLFEPNVLEESAAVKPLLVDLLVELLPRWYFLVFA